MFVAKVISKLCVFSVPIIPDYLYTIDSSKTWENTDAKGKDTPTSITDRYCSLQHTSNSYFILISIKLSDQYANIHINVLSICQ